MTDPNDQTTDELDLTDNGETLDDLAHDFHEYDDLEIVIGEEE